MEDSFVVVTGTKRDEAIAGDGAVLLDWYDAGVDSIRNSFGGAGLPSGFARPILFKCNERMVIFRKVNIF